MDWGIDWLSLGPALRVLMILTGLDIVTGVGAAWANNDVASIASFKGGFKKIGMFVGVAVGMCVDLLIVNYQSVLDISVKLPMSIGGFAAGAFCIHESISILEKLRNAGVPMPGFMLWLLSKLRKTGEAMKLPEIRVKIDSDHVPSMQQKRDARAEAVRQVKQEHQLDRMEHKADANHVLLEENSAILKQQRTAHGAVEDTVTENPVERDHGPS